MRVSLVAMISSTESLIVLNQCYPMKIIKFPEHWIISYNNPECYVDCIPITMAKIVIFFVRKISSHLIQTQLTFHVVYFSNMSRATFR